MSEPVPIDLSESVSGPLKGMCLHRNEELGYVCARAPHDDELAHCNNVDADDNPKVGSWCWWSDRG